MSPIQIVGLAVFAVAMWMGVGYVIGLVSGWHELARAYRGVRFDGARWQFQSGQMRLLMNAHNVLMIDVDPQGLYLATILLFRVGFPPLHIPWQDISVKPGKLLFWNYVEFRFRQAPGVFLQLSADLARKMAVEAGDAWPVDRGAALPF
jgi:hypothetical protein